MRKLKRWTGFWMWIIMGLGSHVWACDCTDQSWEAAYEKANVVVLATCVEITTNPIKGGLNVVFQIDSSWKRKIEPVATIHTNAEGQCGFPFQRGKRYIAFGNKRHQTVETSICEPNMEIVSGDEEPLSRLGEGYAPGRPEMAAKMNLMLIILGALGLLFVGFVVLRKRLRPSSKSN